MHQISGSIGRVIFESFLHFSLVTGTAQVSLVLFLLKIQEQAEEWVWIWSTYSDALSDSLADHKVNTEIPGRVIVTVDHIQVRVLTCPERQTPCSARENFREWQPAGPLHLGLVLFCLSRMTNCVEIWSVLVEEQAR